MKKDSPLLIGAHMSIAGGMDKAIERGASVNCRTIQIFLKNNNQWKGKRISEDERREFRRAEEETGIEPIFAHSCYLINLAATDAGICKKSVAAMADEMERAEFLGVPFIVFHPGAHVGAGEEAGMRKIGDAVNGLIRRTRKLRVKLAYETTAGQGSSIGYCFEHLRRLLDMATDPERVGVCFDTCHVFAAGYDLRTQESYNKTMKTFDDLVGLDRILGFHINDSKKPLGSRRDRHEHIGKGLLGAKAFGFLLRDQRFAHVPKVLETPKGPDLKEDKENLARLRRLARLPARKG